MSANNQYGTDILYIPIYYNGMFFIFGLLPFLLKGGKNMLQARLELAMPI